MDKEYISSVDMEIQLLTRLVDKADSVSIKELLNREIDYKKDFKIKHKNLLEQISGNDTYRKLYTKLLDGKNVSRAVEEVVNENYYNNVKPSSESSIWRYYNNLKKLMK